MTLREESFRDKYTIKYNEKYDKVQLVEHSRKKYKYIEVKENLPFKPVNR